MQWGCRLLCDWIVKKFQALQQFGFDGMRFLMHSKKSSCGSGFRCYVRRYEHRKPLYMKCKFQMSTCFRNSSSYQCHSFNTMNLRCGCDVVTHICGQKTLSDTINGDNTDIFDSGISIDGIGFSAYHFDCCNRS